MALQGSLSDFSIAEILQLLSTQQKTGVLYITLNEREVHISFISGRIVGCGSNGDDNVDLVQILYKAKVLNKDQYNTLKKSLSERDDPVPAILQLQVMGFDELDRIRNLYIEELICSLFTWKEGKYQFDNLDAGQIFKQMDPLQPQTILMEGFRRLEEWPLIRAKVNNYGIVYRVIKEPESLENDAQALERVLEDAFSEFVDDAPAAPKKGAMGSSSNLGPNERALIKLIDGKLAVEELVDRSLLGDFETCKALFTLHNEGFIEPLKVKRSRAVPGRHRGPNRTALAIVGNGLIVAALIGIFVLMPTSKSEFELNSEEVMHTISKRLKNNRKTAIISALEVYRLEHGAYPDKLSDLLKEGLVDKSILIKASSSAKWRYTSVGVDYDLR